MMPSHPSCMRPKGIQHRYRHTHPRRHYYDPHSAKWHNPSSAQESRYSDFVPSSYDERTFLSRLYKYASSFLLTQPIGGFTQRTPITNSSSSGFGLANPAPYSPADIEMITSSPSPTLHASSASCSPRSSYHGSFAFTRSPRAAYIKPPPPAAFPRHIPQSSNPSPVAQKRPLSPTDSFSTTSTKVTADAGTQYSPPAASMKPPKSTGKKRGTSVSPASGQVPPEPQEPQLPARENAAISTKAESRAASSVTLAKTSSSSSSSYRSSSSPKRPRPIKGAVKYMPAQYEACDTKNLVVLISNMLMELIRFNDEIPLKDGRLTRFHSRAPPGISVIDYLQRLTTHATLSPPILLSMVYYIDRLCALYPAFTISSLTVHRFLITSATVASKGLSDSFWTNNTYARVGGVSLKELALLELEFLWRVEWRIVPKPEVLVDYYRSLVERSEGFKIEEEVPSYEEAIQGPAMDITELKGGTSELSEADEAHA